MQGTELNSGWGSGMRLLAATANEPRVPQAIRQDTSSVKYANAARLGKTRTLEDASNSITQFFVNFALYEQLCVEQQPRALQGCVIRRRNMLP